MNRENNLLPWRVTETLTDEEAREIDQALNDDPDLARERDQLSELRRRLQKDTVPPGDAAACLMATKAKIAREEPQRTGRSRWWLSAGLAAGVVLSFGVWQGLDTNDNREGYETLTNPPVELSGITARIVFSDPLSEEALNAVLAEWNAELLSDGSQSGVYILRFPQNADLTRIGDDPRVRLVRSDDL